MDWLSKMRNKSSTTIKSTVEENSKASPERVDSISYEWTNRHRYLKAATKIGTADYVHSSISLGKMNETPGSRSVYLMTSILHLRQILDALQSELLECVDKQVSDTGPAEEIPDRVATFLKSDPGIARQRLSGTIHLTEQLIWESSQSLFGLLSLAPRS